MDCRSCWLWIWIKKFKFFWLEVSIWSDIPYSGLLKLHLKYLYQLPCSRKMSREIITLKTVTGVVRWFEIHCWYVTEEIGDIYSLEKRRLRIWARRAGNGSGEMVGERSHSTASSGFEGPLCEWEEEETSLDFDWLYVLSLSLFPRTRGSLFSIQNESTLEEKIVLSCPVCITLLQQP